jgi:transposase
VKPPIFVRPVTDTERAQVQAGLRAADAFTLRRCQIVLASARGERAPEIARRLGCDDQTVRNTIHAFNTAGVRSLRRRASRPRTVRAAFDAPRAERLRALLHQRPRDFGKATGIWTLDLAAAVSFEQGLTPTRVSGETIRATLARLGVKWKRAKRWLTSPDPAYARTKDAATA